MHNKQTRLYLALEGKVPGKECIDAEGRGTRRGRGGREIMGRGQERRRGGYGKGGDEAGRGKRKIDPGLGKTKGGNPIYN